MGKWRVPTLILIGSIGMVLLLSAAFSRTPRQAHGKEFESPVGRNSGDRREIHREMETSAGERSIVRKREARRRTNHVLPPKRASSKSRPKHIARTRPPKSASADLGPMMLLFERELGLTPDQRRKFEKILVARGERVDDLQSEIREANVFVRSEYRSRIDTIKRTYYDRMGQCLDSLQHRRFLEILAESRFGDAILFELPEGIEIRD